MGNGGAGGICGTFGVASLHAAAAQVVNSHLDQDAAAMCSFPTSHDDQMACAQLYCLRYHSHNRRSTWRKDRVCHPLPRTGLRWAAYLQPNTSLNLVQETSALITQNGLNPSNVATIAPPAWSSHFYQYPLLANCNERRPRSTLTLIAKTSAHTKLRLNTQH